MTGAPGSRQGNCAWFASALLVLALAALGALCCASQAQTAAPDAARARCGCRRRSPARTRRSRAGCAGASSGSTPTRRLAPLGRRIERAQPTLTVPAGRLCRSRRASGSPARPSASRSARTCTASGSRSTPAALRVTARSAARRSTPSKLSLAIYVPERNNPQAKLVYRQGARGRDHRTAGRLLPHRLDLSSTRSASDRVRRRQARRRAPSAATPTNSIVAADIKVAAGKLDRRHPAPSLRHRHDQARQHAGSRSARQHAASPCSRPAATSSASWSAPFRRWCSAEGEYVVIARHELKTYQSTFQVQSGLDRDVEVIAKESGKQEP